MMIHLALALIPARSHLLLQSKHMNQNLFMMTVLASVHTSLRSPSQNLSLSLLSQNLLEKEKYAEDLMRLREGNSLTALMDSCVLNPEESQSQVLETSV